MQSRGRRVRAAIGLVPLLTGGRLRRRCVRNGVSLDEGHRLSSELESVLVLQSLMAPFVGLVAAVPFAEHDLARLDVAAKSIALLCGLQTDLRGEHHLQGADLSAALA